MQGGHKGTSTIKTMAHAVAEQWLSQKSTVRTARQVLPAWVPQDLPWRDLVVHAGGEMLSYICHPIR